jgi:hypothetical protein
MSPGKILALKIGVPVVLGLALLAGPHLYYRLGVRTCKAGLAAQGEKLLVADTLSLLPLPNTISELPQVLGQFFGLRSLGISQTNPPSGMGLLSPGRAIPCWSQPEIRSTTSVSAWADLGKELARLAPFLESAHAAFKDPVANFPVTYNGFHTQLPHLSSLSGAARIFSAATLYHLHQRDTDAAWTNLTTLIAAVGCASAEPWAVSSSVRVHLAEIAFKTTWEALLATNWSDAQLAQLQQQWQALEFVAPLGPSLAFERAVSLESIESWRASNEGIVQLMTTELARSPIPAVQPMHDDPVSDLLAGGAAGIRTVMFGPMWRAYWSYKDEWLTLRAYQVLLDQLRQVKAGEPWTRVRERIQAGLRQMGRDQQSHDEDDPLAYPNWPDASGPYVFSHMALRMEQILSMAIMANTMRDLAVTAIALQRYQLRHGKSTPSLAALVPDFLTQVPRDPIDGQPLRYRVDSNGAWRLYSVGSNGLDDGGNPNPPPGKSRLPFWWAGQDWLWPQAAKPEEIAAVKAAQK